MHTAVRRECLAGHVEGLLKALGVGELPVPGLIWQHDGALHAPAGEVGSGAESG
jgi:hypothetical protein